MKLFYKRHTEAYATTDHYLRAYHGEIAHVLFVLLQWHLQTYLQKGHTIHVTYHFLPGVRTMLLELSHQGGVKDVVSSVHLMAHQSPSPYTVDFA
jgi:hypothetical protein